MNTYDRTINLIGQSAFDKLQKAHVIIFGAGGVGGWCAESLARSGIGKITIVDFDTVEESNLNRQVVATLDTIGKSKVEALKKHLEKVAGSIEVYSIDKKVEKENIQDFFKEEYDFVIDAVDDTIAKLAIIKYAVDHNLNIISSMGTGNKQDPSKFMIKRLNQTHTCPLAKKLRALLKEDDPKYLDVMVLFSTEIPTSAIKTTKPSSIIYSVASAGLDISKYVIDMIIRNK